MASIFGASFDNWFDFAERSENDGQPFHITEDDVGGATNLGLTYDTYVGDCKQNEQPYNMMRFKMLSMGDVSVILHRIIWCVCRCPQLPLGVDFMVADTAMMSSPKRAVMELQSVLGVTADGILGNETMAAVGEESVSFVVSNFAANYERFVNHLPSAIRFARGWDRRIEQARTICLDGVAANFGNDPNLPPATS